MITGVLFRFSPGRGMMAQIAGRRRMLSLQSIPAAYRSSAGTVLPRMNSRVAASPKTVASRSVLPETQQTASEWLGSTANRHAERNENSPGFRRPASSKTCFPIDITSRHAAM